MASPIIGGIEPEENLACELNLVIKVNIALVEAWKKLPRSPDTSQDFGVS